MGKRIVLLDGYTLNPGDNPWDEIACLGDFTVYDRTPADKIIERAKEAEILLTNKTPLAGQTLDELGKLRYIGVVATGYNVVDVEYAKQKGIPVTNVPEYGTKSVAQFVFALILELCSRVGYHDQAVRTGKWAQVPDFCFWDYSLVELEGKVMGIVGFGRIGRRVGELAHAFGMEVRAYDPVQAVAASYQPFSWTTLPEIFRSADIVSLNCPLTDDNERFVNQPFLNSMKSTALFINAARGPLVDEVALANALNSGQIAGAAVDVVSTEPIRSDNPLLTAKNCYITPHMAWGTLDARKRLVHQAAENLKAFLCDRPQNVVNS